LPADWSTAAQYAGMAEGNALGDSLGGNPYALAAYTWDFIGYELAKDASTLQTP
jgi:hypothetical protein